MQNDNPMAVSLTFKTYEVLIDGEKKTFRAESEESAKKKAQTYCIATGNRKAVIQVVGIAP